MTFKIRQESLKQAYPGFKEKKDYYLNRIEYVGSKLTETMGDGGEIRFFSAPGRTEIGGNHTDHQKGCVLAAAVDLDILGAVRKNNLKVIRIISEGNETVSIDTGDLAKRDGEMNTSAALIRGIAYKMKEKGYPIAGFDAYMVSDVLGGSGLSSSAAFEVIVGTVLNSLFCENAFTPVEIAQIGQYAENEYFGKPCGLMDQMASAVGGVVAIDFLNTDNPDVEKINVDFESAGYHLCIIDSGADHADLTYEYASIPQEMKRVANYFGKEYLREVEEDELMNNIPLLRKECGDRAVLRAMHFIEDNEFARKEGLLLKTGQFDDFLKTVDKSGISSHTNLQNVCVTGSTTHQEIALTLALCKHFLGSKGVARVHGGGFAGTVQVFVENGEVLRFKERMEALLGKGTCHVLNIRPAGGIELLKEE